MRAPEVLLRASTKASARMHCMLPALTELVDTGMGTFQQEERRSHHTGRAPGTRCAPRAFPDLARLCQEVKPVPRTVGGPFSKWLSSLEETPGDLHSQFISKTMRWHPVLRMWPPCCEEAQQPHVSTQREGGWRARYTVPLSSISMPARSYVPDDSVQTA